MFMTKEQEAEVKRLEAELTELNTKTDDVKQQIKAIKADQPPAGMIQKGSVKPLNPGDTKSTGGPFGKRS